MELKLRNGAIALLDDTTGDNIISRDWDQMATGHVVTQTQNGNNEPVVLVLDRLVLAAESGWIVQHRNGNLLDNRSDNLTLVRYEPYRRRRSGANLHSRSGIRGVQYAPKMSPKRPWRAQIAVNNQNYHLGMFATPDEAVAARVAAELCLFGESCQ